MWLNNKWMRGAVPALLIHCSIGSVYAWSLFVTPISAYIGKPTSAVQFAFSLAIFFLGMSAAFAGKLVEKNVRHSSLVSLVCFCAGLLIAALGMRLHSLWILYLGYGCVMGIGLGVGYLTPVKTLMMWFEDKKGLATGIAIMGFGLASTIASPMIAYLTAHFSLEMTFVILACVYSVPMFLGHLLIKKPHAEDPNKIQTFHVRSLLKNKTVIFIWLMFYLNIHCGLALISTAAPLMTERGVAVGAAATVVAVMGLFNAGGRLVFASASDYLKDRITIYHIIFTVSILSVIIALIFGVNMGLVFGFAFLLCVISSTYGAGFSCLPVLLSDRFSMSVISRVHGLCLTAWAVAGLTGNQMASLLHDYMGNYTNVLYVLLALYAVAFLFSTQVKKAVAESV